MQALSIEELVKTYPTGVQALRGISFSVEEGDFFALLGPNGAGKSTTIGIVTSLVNKTSGRVVVFGHDLDSQSAAVKSSIGMVPQEFNFNQFEKVRDIVVNQAGYYGIGRREACRRAEEFLSRLDLWDKRNAQSRTLSGGMKRRLMIARALIHRPRLLILDEPTAGVDIEIRRSMWQFLHGLNRDGTTIILTTHYLEEAESLCRNIAIIDDGRIVEHTSMKGLLAKLHVEAFLLDVAAPLERPPIIDGYSVSLLDPFCIEVVVEKSDALNDLFARLGDQGIRVMSMRNRRNRLEELFMNLVDKGDTSRGR